VTDVAAAYGMAGRPLWFVFAALFVIVMGRSHLFYWLGRGVFSGAAHLADQATHGRADEPRTETSADVVADLAAVDVGAGARAGAVADGATGLPDDDSPGRAAALRARAQRLLHTPAARRGLALVHRWGPLAVTAAYVTIGVQTAVFIGSGLVRMPYLRFTIASIPGSVAWALIWGTVGLGVVWGAVRLAATSPWGFAAVALAAAAVVTGVLLRRRTRTRTPATEVHAVGPGAPLA
jgi:hypothetical protein